MKCSLGSSNFLAEISGFSHFIVFLYFFALITEEGFLISLWYSLELCIQMLISFLFSLLFTSLLFTAICKASSDSHFAFLHFFSMGMVWIPVSCTMSWTSIHSSSSTLSIRSSPLNTPLNNVPLVADCVFLHALTARKFGASSAAWLSGCLYRYALHHSGGAMFPSE